MGNGVIKEVQNLENFKSFSNEYEKLRMAGLSAEEIHGILLKRIENTKSILSNDIPNFDSGSKDSVPLRAQNVSTPKSAPLETKSESKTSSPTKHSQNEQESQQKPKTDSAPAKPSKEKHIGLALLIDDSAVAAKVASKVLVMANLDVVTANSAKMGFDILVARKDDVNIIFLDVVMPNVDGVECLSWIKDNAELSHIPVYMLSGLEDQMLSDVCVERGAEGMLLKPLSLDTLKTIIRSHGIGEQKGDEKLSNVNPTSNASTSRESAQLDDPFTNKAKKTVAKESAPNHPYSVIANASPPNISLSSLIPAFKLVDSNFNEYVFPSPSTSKKLMLLVFIPTIYCPALYEEGGFLVRLLQNYEMLMYTQQVTVACISGDLPFALAAAKQRFRIPFVLLSDPSLFITQKIIGVMNIGPVLAYQELLHHQDEAYEEVTNESEDNIDFNKFSAEYRRKIATSSSHIQQTLFGPRLGMFLVSRRREVMNMWLCPFPASAKGDNGLSSMNPGDVSLIQFPSNFKEWIDQIAKNLTRSTTDTDDTNFVEDTKKTKPTGRGTFNSVQRKEGAVSVVNSVPLGHPESKGDDTKSPIERDSSRSSKRASIPVVSKSNLQNSDQNVVHDETPTAVHVENTPNRRLTVLVIDDSSVSSRVVCKKLESFGYTVQTAYDGQKGYDIVKKRVLNFDLVLCDVVMPICDGMGFLKLIKNDDEVKHIPVVMLSGLEGEELSKGCIDLGAYALLKKPFDENRFAEIVNELKLA